jgi:hypothetical protein
MLMRMLILKILDRKKPRKIILKSNMRRRSKDRNLKRNTRSLRMKTLLRNCQKIKKRLLSRNRGELAQLIVPSLRM